MRFSEEFIRQWEHIIDEVLITDVPVECIKKVIIKLQGRRQKTINVQMLRRQGMETEEIEMLITRQLSELSAIIRDVDFMLDVEAVAELVQPETDKLLRGI
jgi:hypothetical protein